MRTWIEIDAAALRHNIGQIRRLIGPQLALGLVVKANAYGHGLALFAQLVKQEPTISWLFVGGIEEALLLRRQAVSQQIMVLSYLDTAIDEALRQNIVLTIGDLSSLLLLQEAVLRTGHCARVHIKIDSGMHRLGILPEALPALLDQITQMRGVRVEGLFTHLASANDLDMTITDVQVNSFFDLCKAVDPLHRWLWHISASGSLWRGHLGDIARVGTMAYGSWKSDLHRSRCEAAAPGITLQPVMRWKARMSSIKTVAAGEAVGYDRSFIAPRQMRLAIVPVGYADGYARCLSNRGSVAIGRFYAPVVGIISMNLLMVDVTDLSESDLAEEITLIGAEAEVTPLAIARQIGTNPNEITSRLQASLPRYIIDTAAVDAAQEQYG